MKIQHNETRNALEVTSDGEQYQTLARIADVLNTVQAGNTAETVCRDFLLDVPEQHLKHPEELADFVIGDCAEDAEVKAAFVRAGLWGRRRMPSPPSPEAEAVAS